MTNETKERQRIFITFVVYLVATFFVMFLHESWRDEAAAWLIAKNLSWPGIFMEMRYEGHFALWYYLLKPFTGGSIQYMRLIAWLLTLAAAWLALFRSRFGFGVKCAILLSGPMIYWYPAVARNYALIPPILFLLAALHPKRLEHTYVYAVLIALLANTHAYIEGVVAALFFCLAADWFREKGKVVRRRIALSMLIVLAGAGIAFAQVAPAFAVSRTAPEQLPALSRLPQIFLETVSRYCIGYGNFTFIVDDAVRHYGSIVFAALYAGLVVFLFRRERAFCGLFLACLALFVGLAAFLCGWTEFVSGLWLPNLTFLSSLIVMAALLFRISHRGGLILIAGLLYQFLFSMFIYPFMHQRSLLTFIIMVFCCWIAFADREEKPGLGEKAAALPSRYLNMIVLCLALFTMPGSFWLAARDVRYPYSGLEDIGSYIRENLNPAESVTFFPYSDYVTAVAAFAPEQPFYSIDGSRRLTHFRYTKGPSVEEETRPEAVPGILYDYFSAPANRDKHYLVTSIYFMKIYGMREHFTLKDLSFDIVYCSSNDVIDKAEYYILYRVTRNAGRGP